MTREAAPSAGVPARARNHANRPPAAGRPPAPNHPPATNRPPAATASLPLGSGRGIARSLLATARPRQWIKNSLVIAAAGAAGAIGRDDVPLRVALTAVAFCLLSSGIYAINDVRDADEDRGHPRKRHRPVAAGELGPAVAVRFGASLIIAGVALCAAVRPLVALVGLGYVVISVTYTLLWRHIAFLDVLAIAAGFVLRALAGGVAAPVALSRWFVLVITFGAIFIAAAKRMGELTRTLGAAASRRRVLRAYSPGRLRLLLAASAAGMLIAYCGWAFELPAIHGFPWRPLTIIPVVLCLLRYRVLIDSGSSEAPEELVLGDPALMVLCVTWVVVFALGVHAAG